MQKQFDAHLKGSGIPNLLLEELYTKIIADCDEMKLSFLSRAFAGE